MSEVTANYDESWKEALEEYFESFLSFFFPSVHEAIDWTHPPESLDKELQQITASDETKKRIADKLYKVWLLNKKQVWILINVEIQSQYDVEFPERIYIYNYRASNLHQKPVVSLAILGDTGVNWRPDSYEQDMLGCGLRFYFPVVKLLDYQSRLDELESNNNPFAIIVIAHLKTKATNSKLSEREEWKWRIIRGLYERGLTKVQIVKLFKIIDKMMTLPKRLQSGLIDKIKHLEEQKEMPFISPTEELAMEREAQKLVMRQLKRRIGEINSSLIKQVEILELEPLEELGEALLDFSHVTDLEQWLRNRPEPVELSESL
jgi:hypothetical protein